MPDDNRVALYVRVTPSIKNEAAEAAYQERLSLARFVERAMQDRIQRHKGEATRAGE